MAASCLWQVDAINLDQLNADADDNEQEQGGRREMGKFPNFFTGCAFLQYANTGYQSST